MLDELNTLDYHKRVKFVKLIFKKEVDAMGKYTINVRLLESKMVLYGYNIGTFASAVGVSRDTVSNLLKRKTKPSYNLIIAICDTLKLNQGEIHNIFFTKELS